MSTKVPAKSILTQQPTTPKPTLSDEQKAQAERDRRNLGIALHHANRIQYQKDIEAQILSSIEILLDFPASESYTPAEASKFITLVQPFQPSDFDSLIEERTTNGKCGYALCSKPPRSVTIGPSVVWRLKGKGAGDYCSNDCVKKALYVKAQLSEVPASERGPNEQPEIVLYEDDPPSIASSSTDKATSFQERVANDRELALERGETTASFKPGQVMTSAIINKPSNSHKPLATIKNTPSSHKNIEGYEPRHGSKQTSTTAKSIAGIDLEEMIEAEPATDDGEDDSWRDLYRNIDRR